MKGFFMFDLDIKIRPALKNNVTNLSVCNKLLMITTKAILYTLYLYSRLTHLSAS